MAHEQWNLGIGLRRAVVHLAIWSLLCGAAWTAAAYAATPFLNRYSARAFSLPSAAFGAVIGWALMRRLADVAGFAGWFLAFLAFVFAAATIVGGMTIVDVLRPLNTGVMFYIGGPTCIGALAVILWLGARDS